MAHMRVQIEQMGEDDLYVTLRRRQRGDVEITVGYRGSSNPAVKTAINYGDAESLRSALAAIGSELPTQA